MNKTGAADGFLFFICCDRIFFAPSSDPKPFVWTADPKRVLAAVKRGKQVLELIH